MGKIVFHLYDFVEQFTLQSLRWAVEEAKDATEILVRINSPGGDIFAGFAIYQYLKSLDMEVTTQIDGICASMASVIFLAGDKKYVAENGFMLLHFPWSSTGGNSKELKKKQEMLDKLGEKMVAIYVDHSNGKTEEEIKAIMDEAAWLDANEIIEMGFADEITPDLKIAASIGDLEVPEKVKASFVSLQTPAPIPPTEDNEPEVITDNSGEPDENADTTGEPDEGDTTENNNEGENTTENTDSNEYSGVEPPVIEKPKGGSMKELLELLGVKTKEEALEAINVLNASVVTLQTEKATLENQVAIFQSRIKEIEVNNVDFQINMAVKLGEILPKDVATAKALFRQDPVRYETWKAEQKQLIEMMLGKIDIGTVSDAPAKTEIQIR